MAVEIDVIYLDGEAVAFRNRCSGHVGARPLVLTRNLAVDIVLRFCTAQGEALEVIPLDEFGHAQALLSYRDRLLLALEENITLEVDEGGFQLLKISRMVPESAEIRSVLADSYLEAEEQYQGVVPCDFSCAVYADSSELGMQLFFTLDAVLKNAVLPAEQ